MARPTPLSGFPEWLPAGRIVEQHVLDVLRRTFELYGYAGIETRAVEPLDQLLRKGETSKEVYVLRRLQEPRVRPRGSDRPEQGLGLHFDLTVPFARYVLENAGRLTFPFKRYQVQKVWRGERPQDGRFREFCQADIDVVGLGELPYHYEVEVPLVVAEAFASLRAAGMPPVQVLVNNRKVVEGFARGLGLDDVDAVLRAVDKLDKIGEGGVSELLGQEAGANAGQAEAVLALAGIRGTDTVADEVRALAARHRVSSDLLDAGLSELAQLLEAAAVAAPGVLVADLKIARGLDYYTGSVYETVLVGHEELGSVVLRRPVRLAGQRRGHDLPRGGDLRGRLAAGVPPALGRAGHRHAHGAERRPGRGDRRGRPAGVGPRSPRRCAPEACRSRWRRPPRSSASRSGMPTGVASRSCGSPHRTATRSRTSGRVSRCPPTGVRGCRPPRTCTPG